jgi:hypothetical protein
MQCRVFRDRRCTLIGISNSDSSPFLTNARLGSAKNLRRGKKLRRTREVHVWEQLVFCYQWGEGLSVLISLTHTALGYLRGSKTKSPKSSSCRDLIWVKQVFLQTLSRESRQNDMNVKGQTPGAGRTSWNLSPLWASYPSYTSMSAW